jgi:hypothetical protein
LLGCRFGRLGFIPLFALAAGLFAATTTAPTTATTATSAGRTPGLVFGDVDTAGVFFVVGSVVLISFLLADPLFERFRGNRLRGDEQRHHPRVLERFRRL